MNRFQPTIGPKPAADSMTFAHPPMMPAVSNAVTADYGILSKLIEKQVGMASGQHAREFQRQLNQFVFDLRKKFDRVLEENQRLLKTLEELQGGQSYLLQQLELHQKREELAILREQQDGKRIRELENRLSYLLFEPIQNQRISIDMPELRRFAIHQPELLKKTDETQSAEAMVLTPSEDDLSAETSPGDGGNGIADTFLPPLEARVVDLVADALVEDGLPGQLDEEPVGQPPEEGAAVDDDSDVIDLLEEVVDTPREEDKLLSDASVSESTIPDVRAPEYMSGVAEPVESSTLNTNFVLQGPRETLMASEKADPEAKRTKAELVSIITLEDEIPVVRSFDVSPSIEGVEDDSGQDIKGVSNESFAQTPLPGADTAISPDCPASLGFEECLETVEEADTNTFDIIELKEDAILGQPENGAAKAVTILTHEPVAAPVEEAVVEAADEPVVSKDTETLSQEQQWKPTDAKTHFKRGKLACQRKDYAKAVDSFNRYRELSPNDPRGPYNLAILHYRLKEYTRAAANARKALDLGYTAADRIIAKIKTKTEPVAESDIAVENSVSDAWLETETLHDLSLTEPAAVSKEKGAAVAPRDNGKSSDAVLPMTRGAVLKDNRFEPATGEPPCGVERSSEERSGVVDASPELFEDRMNFPATEIDDSTGAEDTASIWDIDELGEEIDQSLFSAATEENRNSKKNDLIVFDAAALDERNFVEDEAAGSSGTVPGQSDPEQFFENERLKHIYKLGQTAVENKEYLKAIQHFTKVTHLAPRDHRGYCHLAEVSFQLRFYETARQHAKRAIELGSTAAKNILSQISALQVPA